MLIHKKKHNLFFFFLSIFIAIFLSLLLATPGFKGDIEQSIKIRLNQAVLFRSLNLSENHYKDYYFKTIYALENFLFGKNEYEKIELDIPFKELEKIKTDRKRALKIKRLINPTNTNIRIKYKGKSYKARARLKGDLSDHWGNNKQWSLRISLRNNKTIFGLNSFGLMMHETREFPYNYLVEEVLKSYELLHTYYQPVKVKVNGDNWGIMLIEEQYSDSFFAKSKIKEAPIFRFKTETGEHLLSQYNYLPNIKNISKWQGFLDVSVGYKKIFKKTNIPGKKTNETLHTIAKNIHQSLELNKEEYFNEIINYIDVEKFAKAYAVASAFGSFHSIAKNNIRYYISPYTLKLEPIIRDHGPKKLTENNIHYNKIYILLLKNENFKKIFRETIFDLEKKLSWIKKKNKEICMPYGKICEKQFRLEELKQNINYLKNNELNFKNILRENKGKFDTKNNYNINKKKLNIRAFTDGTLSVSNLTSEKIILKKILISKSSECSNCNLKIDYNIEPSNFDKISNYEIQLNYKSKKGDSGTIYYIDENKNNFNQSIILEDHKLKPSLIFNPSKKNKNQYLKIKDNKYILPKGEYFIKNPIIIPKGYNFVIEEGSILKMSKDSYIEIKDGSINFDGKKDMPIKIQSSETGTFWKGIYVSSKQKKMESKINNVEISNIDFFDNSLIQLTGGINFYNSKVSINNSKFTNSISEDAINLINSNFEINNIEIFNTKSDAIDFDFSSGNINEATFKNISGDGLDFSGSKVNLSNINLNKVEDKGISAGEKSSINLYNLNISDAKIGIASKDSSSVIGEKISLKNCVWYDFASYKKKSYFKGGYMNLKKVSGCNKSMAQNKSLLIVNDSKIKTRKINIKDLYNGKYQ